MAREYCPEAEAIVTAFGCQMTLLSDATERAVAALTELSESLEWLDTLARIEAERRGEPYNPEDEI
jgi:hypothetical protein